jgi:hypothetical protein
MVRNDKHTISIKISLKAFYMKNKVLPILSPRQQEHNVPPPPPHHAFRLSSPQPYGICSQTVFRLSSTQTLNSCTQHHTFCLPPSVLSTNTATVHRTQYSVTVQVNPVMQAYYFIKKNNKKGISIQKMLY